MSLSHVHPGDVCVYTDGKRTRHLVTVIGMWPATEAEPADPLVSVVTYSGYRGMSVPLSSLHPVQIGKCTEPLLVQHRRASTINSREVTGVKG